MQYEKQKCVTFGQEKLSFRNTACAELYLPNHFRPTLMPCFVCVSTHRLQFLETLIRTRTPFSYTQDLCFSWHQGSECGRVVQHIRHQYLA
jgi:hypothetical protein